MELLNKQERRFFSTCVKNNDDAEEEESGDAVKNVVDKAVLFSLVT